MKVVNFAITVALLVFSGCAHTNKSPTQDVLTPDYLLSKGSKQLTFLGDNERPRFSADGTKIIYVSRQRATHKGAQIYELDLIKNKERRVTFSDGDAFDPTYVSDSEIIYASTTDEIKENPIGNRTIDSKNPPSEIYMSDLYGGEILRLNVQPGYDAEPIFVAHAAKPYILFSSHRGDLAGIYRLDLKNLPVSFLSVEKGKERRSPAVSPDYKQIAWIEKDLANEEQSLVLYTLKGKISLVLKKGEGDYRDLFWSPRVPNRLFYSILRKGEKFYQIESLLMETGCTQVVFKGTDSLLYPTLSNESPERLAFARVFQDKKQIYMVPLPQDLGPCLAAPTQATLKE
jgi:dipeptidyl aminopeptidase/acylaminoacyl peptidase